MKAITLYQPWATLVAMGKKRIETRSWSTNYRGPLAIHAGQNKKYITGNNYSIIGQEPFRSALLDDKYGYPTFPDFPLGRVVATCELIGCIKIPPFQTRYISSWGNGLYRSECYPNELVEPGKDDLVINIPPEEPEISFGDYTPGRYAWILTNIRDITGRCIYARGGLGMWDLPADVEKEVLK
jgi:hypothetical protein